MSNLYLTEELIADFGGAGGEKLLEVLEIPDQSFLQQEDTISQLFTEILLAYEAGKIELDHVVQFLVMGVKNDTLAKIFCQVIDVLPITNKIDELLQLIIRKDSIKVSTIASYLSSDSLKDLTIVPKQSLIKSLNIKKRDEFYTQKKFNLFHEESEGFAKFVVELYEIFKSEDTDYQINYAVTVIETLIGHYSLDPNKCLDLLLEVYAAAFVPRVDFAFKLLRKSRWWPAVEGDVSSLSTLNVGGNDNAAKILGLKLVKYQDDKDLPETFKILIACLIKEGFISFGSLYKYLKPNDLEMESLEKLYNKRLNDKVSKAGANALALAAPLLDDEEPDSKETTKKSQEPINEDEEFEKKLKYNMKYQILRALLSCGAYWPSVFILTNFPFLAYVDDDIHQLMTRLYDSMVQPLYNQIKPFTNEDLLDFQNPKKAAFTRPQNHVHYETQSYTELLSFNPTIKSYGQKRFIFFYRSWNENLPQVSSTSQLFQTSKDFVKFIGTNLSSNLQLFIKICEIGYEDLKNNQNEDLKQEWFHYFRNFIFPAMCVIEENSIAIEKAYSILSFYSVEERFSVYGELYQLLAKNNPRVRIAYNKAEKSTKDVLKRLSKENVRPMMRRLAKISFSNPLPCLLTILQQIESYDNLNSLVVETARYFNSYGWDTLTVAILIRLTVTGRTSVQANGIFDRQWIQSLASFIGKICQRYPNAIDIKTILEFLLKSFHSGERMGLIVLKEILSSMGGMQSITNLTLHQIDMINCGSSLQKVVYRVISDVRYARMKPGSILVKTFGDMNAINEFLVLLSQIKQEFNQSDESEHLKVLANKNDELDAVINLFTTLVTFFGTQEQLEDNLLSISDLCTEYQVPVQIAFDIWRPILSKRSDSGDKLFHLKKNLTDILSPTILENITSELFTTFWHLSLHDINYSDELYESELTKLKASTKSLKDAISSSSRDKHVTRSAIEKLKSDFRTNEEFIDQLPTDKERHLEHNTLIVSRLSEESKSWFDESTSAQDRMQYFLQYCILPRAIHSSFDALYCGRFLFKLHELNTANFSLINLLDILIKSKILFATLFTSTTTEAENLGLFFSEVLGRLNNWATESEFNKEANNDTVNLTDAAGDALTYDDYRTTLYGYHDMILEDIGDALIAEEYMCRRNAITFLKNLVSIYPNVEDHCEKLADLIQNIIATEEREDLKLSSSALMGHLKSRSNGWVHLWDFIPLSDELKEAHVKVRKEKKEKIAEEKRQREEEKRKVEEAKIAKAAEEKQRKLKVAMNYDSEQSGKTLRPDSRNVGSSGRYDNYSNYKQPSETLADAKPVRAVTNSEAKDGAEAKAETINTKDSEIETSTQNHEKSLANKDNGRTSKIDEGAASSEKNVDDKKAADIKAKLQQARKEFAASTNQRDSRNQRDSSNQRDSTNRRDSTNQRDSTNDRHRGDKSRSRTPLPDQSEYNRSNPRGYGPGSSARNSKYNRHSYDKEPQSDLAPPPPPPPPPPPVSRSKNDYGFQNNRGNSRYGNRDNYNDKGNRDGNYDEPKPRHKTYDKRKNDGYGSNGRHYDKRQKY